MQFIQILKCHVKMRGDEASNDTGLRDLVEQVISSYNITLSDVISTLVMHKNFREL